MPRPIARFASVVVLALSIVVTTAAVATAVPPTLEGRYAYWTGYQGSTIQRADVGGGPVETIWSSFNTTPTGVAVDRSTGDIYWSTRNTTDIYTSEADGSNAHTLNIGSAVADSTLGIAVDASVGRVYWANSDDTIYWAATDGSGTSGQLSTGAAPISYAWGLAIDLIAGKIYWANSDTSGGIPDGGWAKLDNSDTGGPLGGTTGTGFNVGMAFVPGLNSVFWTEYFTNSVIQTPLDGGPQSTLPALGAPLNGAAGIGYDAATNTLYVANYDGQSITYMNANDGNGGTLANGLTDVPYGQIAVSGAGHLTKTSGPASMTAPIGGSTHGDFQFTNDGNYPLVFGTPRATGDAAFVKGPGCEGESLDIGDTCTFSVTFAPTTGGPATGILEFPTDVGTAQLYISGFGQGGTFVPPTVDPLISGVKAVKRCASSGDAGKLSAALTSATVTTTTATLQKTSTQRKRIPRVCPDRAAGTGYVGRVIGNASSAAFQAAAGTQTKSVKQLFGVKSLKPGRYRLAFTYTDATGQSATRKTSFWVLGN